MIAKSLPPSIAATLTRAELDAEERASVFRLSEPEPFEEEEEQCRLPIDWHGDEYVEIDPTTGRVLSTGRVSPTKENEREVA